jgi:alpha-glucoside transport system permease protein
VVALLVAWLFVRYWGIIGEGIGGFRINDDGTVTGNPVLFIQESPFNNFWLMVILIWIQTGFAMVILSAAIKAVPTEFLEAARVDGATESQIFWRVTLPQIATTIGVVVTTLVVLVMKVFDIVKVVTNGNYGTQVLANNMYQEAFQFGNAGTGAALAMLILISVLPVMIYNIRRMNREH